MNSDVIVVGGGVGGLVVARRLALRGARVTLLERGEVFGGQVAPLPVGGIVLDAAAESFATRGGIVAALADELGLAGDIVLPAPTPAWLHRTDGTAVPLPAAGVLGIPGAPLAPDVVRAVGRWGAWRAAFDRLLPARVGRHAASIDELVRVRMGSAVADALVAPVVRGVHSIESSALSVDAASPRLRAEIAARGSLAAAVGALRAQSPAGSQVASIRGGMHRLVAALVAENERLGVDLRTRVEVTQLDATGVTADGTRVDGRVVRAYSEPAASPRRLTLVTLVVEAPAWDAAPRGTGLLVDAAAPGVTARALTHITAKWAWVRGALPDRQVVRLSYDGDPVDPIALATRDAPILLGAEFSELTDAAVTTWQRGVAPSDGPVPAVGEGAAGTGLAAVVAHAERVADELLTVP